MKTPAIPARSATQPTSSIRHERATCRAVGHPLFLHRVDKDDTWAYDPTRPNYPSVSNPTRGVCA